jgi:hypothetical protein
MMKKLKKLFIFTLTLFAIFGLAACKNDATKAKSSPWDEKKMTYSDSMAVIKIGDIKQTTDFQGKPAITINYTLTNKSSKTYGKTQFTNSLLAAYQDKKYLLSAILDINSDNMGGDTVAPKGKIESSVSYSLTNTSDEVTLKFISSTSHKSVGSYKISFPLK